MQIYDDLPKLSSRIGSSYFFALNQLTLYQLAPSLHVDRSHLGECIRESDFTFMTDHGKGAFR